VYIRLHEQISLLDAGQHGGANLVRLDIKGRPIACYRTQRSCLGKVGRWSPGPASSALLGLRLRARCQVWPRREGGGARRFLPRVHQDRSPAAWASVVTWPRSQCAAC